MLHNKEGHLCGKVWCFPMRLLKVVAESDSISCYPRVMAATQSTGKGIVVQPLQLDEIQSGTMKDRAQVRPPTQNIYSHSRIPVCTVTAVLGMYHKYLLLRITRNVQQCRRQTACNLKHWRWDHLWRVSRQKVNQGAPQQMSWLPNHRAAHTRRHKWLTAA